MSLLPRLASVSRPSPIHALYSCRRTFASSSRFLGPSTSGIVIPARYRAVTPFAHSLHRRHFSDNTQTTSTSTDTPVEKKETGDYVGPLSNTFRRLKIFSMASFGLSVTLAPFMFIIESNLPYSGRFALASVALGTSGLSTALVAWCAKPYVNTLRRYKPDGEKGGEVVELTTASFFLKPRVTTVR